MGLRIDGKGKDLDVPHGFAVREMSEVVKYVSYSAVPSNVKWGVCHVQYSSIISLFLGCSKCLNTCPGVTHCAIVTRAHVAYSDYLIRQKRLLQPDDNAQSPARSVLAPGISIGPDACPLHLSRERRKRLKQQMDISHCTERQCFSTI